MLQKIELTNCQSHKHTTLQLHPNVNVIVGSSDSGKSAIIRAIRWALENKPLGDGLRSHWGGQTISRLTFTDVVVERGKNKTENYYKLQQNGAEQVFKALGHGVPDEVQQALNTGEENLQRQSEMYYLIDRTPGAVAHHFNQVANLEKIDSSRKRVESRITTATNMERTRRADLQLEKEKYKKYSYLPALEKQVAELEQLETQHDELISAAQRLTQIMERVQELAESIKQKKRVTAPYSAICTLIGLYTHKKEKIAAKMVMYSKIKEITDISQQLQTNKKQIGALGKIEMLLKHYNTLEDLQQQTKKLSAAMEQVQIKTVKLKDDKLQLKKMEQEFHSSFPDLCPLCGTTKKKK